MGVAYIPGETNELPGPLGRYLPVLPKSIAPVWLENRVEPGSWVLDPFGSSPRLDFELAQKGYRVLVAANNPILRFLLKMGGIQAGEPALQAALAKLAAIRKGNERLELYIQSLYLTECVKCGRLTPAEAFLWERDARAPYARIYHCTHCDDSGEYPIAPGDLERLEPLQSGGLHRARALERLVTIDDPTRENVEEALNCYLNRPLHALFTLINKMEGLQAPPEQRLLMTALILAACDSGNTLWPHPVSRARPRQLVIPPRFREQNIWFALEDAVTTWGSWESAVPMTKYPKLPASGAICLYKGRLKELAGRLDEIPIQSVVMAIPRINQAFWTLSALWAGWLWGQEAVLPFKSVLSRRRYDWNWHCAAITATLTHLRPHIRPETPCLALLSEIESPFLSAVLMAAQASGYSLEGFALRAEEAQAQITWVCSPPQKPISQEHEGLIFTAARNYLIESGEPASYLPLHGAVLNTLAQHGALPDTPDATGQLTLSMLQGSIQNTLKDRETFQRFEGSESSLETGLWWLNDSEECNSPLMDRIEMEVVRFLQQNPGATLAEIDRGICLSFPGSLTPSFSFLNACLASYAEERSIGSSHLYLRQKDSPKTRKEEILQIVELLHILGQKLGYQTGGDSPHTWKNRDGKLAYSFHVIASAIVSRFLLDPDNSPEKSIIVLPGGRAGLLAAKLERDPRLRQVVQAGWRFLKFRFLRQLAENPRLSPEMWDSQLSADSIEPENKQMALF